MLFEMGFQIGFQDDHVTVGTLAEALVERNIRFRIQDPYRREILELFQHQGTIIYKSFFGLL